jgi:LmbE family N-acetylglucosaminyl deacetylase
MSATDNDFWRDEHGASLDQEPPHDEIQHDDDGVIFETPTRPRKMKDEASKLWRREHPVIELANESLFTTLQVGALRRLRQQYWRLGALPNDERKLQRLAGLTDDEWAANRDDLAEQFTDWRDTDLDEARQSAIRAYQDQVEGGRKRQADRRARAESGRHPAD